MTSYRLFGSGHGGNGANGPSAATSYSGDLISGIMFSVTEKVCWFEGYWFWCAATVAPTAAQEFALYSIHAYSGNAVGDLISGSVVTSGSLTAGAWNWVPLSAPVPLSIGGNTAAGVGGATYCACTGVNGSFSDSNTTGGDAAHSFGTGGYTGGIINGPLTAWSGLASDGGTNPVPTLGNVPGPAQGVYTTGGTDPSALMPNQDDHAANLWMDVQVNDAAPPGYGGSYRLWPNYADLSQDWTNDTGEQTTGTQFSLSASCTLDKVWFYSPPSATVLPARTQIWDVSMTALVSGSDISASWSGAAGSGWVSNSYTGVTLPPGNYIATVFHGSDGQKFYVETRGYFGTYSSVAGPAEAAGISNGPLSAPSNSAAITLAGFGNSCYYTGGSSPAYPNAYDTGDGGENRWIDVEVTPVTAAASGLALIPFP